MTTDKASKGRFHWLIEQFGAAVIGGGLVSIIVTALFNLYLTTVLENKKEKVSELIQTSREFTNAQTSILLSLALYDNDIVNKGRSTPEKRDAVLKSIVETQVKLVALSDAFQLSDNPEVVSYRDQLMKLSSAVRHSSGQDDLVGILNSANKLLEINDKLSKETEPKTNINVLPW